METFEIGLKLVENVSQPGKRAADSLKAVTDQAKKAQDALASRQMGSLGKQFEKIGFAASRAQVKQEAASKRSLSVFEKNLQRTNDVALRSQRALLSFDPKKFADGVKLSKALQMAKKKALADAGMEKGNTGFFSGLFKWANPHGLGRVSSHVVGELIADGIFKAGEALFSIVEKAAELFGEGIKFAFESAGKRQAITLGERLSLGAGAKPYQDDIKRFSKLTGMHSSEIEELLLPLRRSGMNQQDTRTAFAAASDVAAGKGKGGDRGEIEKYLKAFETLRLRGNIEIEQLAGLGIDVHKFYKTIAKKTGVDEQTARTNMTNGKVNRGLMLNTLYENIEKEQGGKLGTGAIAYSKTFQARMDKLKQLPEQLLMSIAGSAAFQRASDAIGSLLELLDPEGPRGQRIIASLQSMFDKVAGYVGTPEDAADSMADHLENALGLLGQMVEVGRELADAFLPSLETLEDMILAFREFKAYSSGNVGDQMAVAIDRRSTNQRRYDRSAEQQVKGATPGIVGSKLATNMLDEQLNQTIGGFEGPIALNPLALGTALVNTTHDTQVAQNDLRRAGGSSRQVAVTAPKIELNFYGPVDEDTARAVAPEIHRETTSALEQAAAGSF